MKIAMFPRGSLFCEGGTATYLQNLLPILNSRGYEITLYSTEENSILEKKYDYINFKHFLGKSNTIDSRMNNAKIQLEDAIRFGEYDIFHLHHPAALIILNDLNLNNKEQIVVTHHGDQLIRKNSVDFRGEDMYNLYLNYLKSVSGVVVHSNYFYESYLNQGISVKNINIGAPKEIKTDKCYLENFDLDPDNFILYLGKIRREKGLDLLLEAYKGIISDTSLVVVGNCEFEPDFYQEILKIAVLDRRVKIVGEVFGKEKAALLKYSKFLVNPLKIMGLPLGVLEAMTYKTAVLNSNLSTHHSVIKSSTHLFENDNVNSLRLEISNMLFNFNLRNKIGNSGFNFVNKYHNWEKIADLYESIYRKK